MNARFSLQQVIIVSLFAFIVGCVAGAIVVGVASVGPPSVAENTLAAEHTPTHSPTILEPTSVVLNEPPSNTPFNTPTVTILVEPTARPTSTSTLKHSDHATPTLPKAKTATPTLSTSVTITVTAEEATSLAQEEANQAGPDELAIQDPVVSITEQYLELTGRVVNLGLFGSGELRVIGVPVVEDGELHLRLMTATVNNVDLPRSLFPGIESTVDRVLARSLFGYDAQEVVLGDGLMTLVVLPWP
jgi:hypothetical protein